MKKILAVLVLVLFGTVSYAQWATSGNNIYNTNTGNVGIGTGTVWSPTDKLHLKTAGTTGLMLESSSTATGPFGYFRIKNSTGHQLNIVMRKSATGDIEMLQSAYDPIVPKWCEYIYFNYTTHKYEIRDGITDAEFKNVGKLLLNNAGGVGVGVTTIPAGVKFAVNGKVNCKEVEVTLTGWSDKVFNKDYTLMPLNDVESFINANSHLPGVPSEKEIMSKPANLGEMDALLLQKIEELTLYVIELKKENNVLKTKIENLK